MISAEEFATRVSNSSLKRKLKDQFNQSKKKQRQASNLTVEEQSERKKAKRHYQRRYKVSPSLRISATFDL
jgi:hypothetical protein